MALKNLLLKKGEVKFWYFFLVYILRAYIQMSNFYEQKDDSNLQYDDAAFLYFLASALSISAIVLTISVLKDLWKMKLKNTEELDKVKIFEQKLKNLSSLRRKRTLNCTLVLKLLFIIGCCFLFFWVSNAS